MMKFEKMNNGALRCILNKEDLEENGVVLEDFFSNNANAREFLEKLIQIAEEEVGYQTSGNMMSIQAAIISEDEIVLTFSESQISGSEIIEHIKNMFAASDTSGAEKQKPDMKEAIIKEARGQEQARKIQKDMEGYAYLLTFVSFSSVRKFCQILPINPKTDSRLYYLDKKKQYFLWADLNASSKAYVYEFVAASMEYATNIEKDSVYSSYLEEHADIILKENALETLAQL